MAAMVIGWVLSLLIAMSLVLTWRAQPGHRSFKKPPWWAWGEPSWRGYRRAQLPFALIIFAFALALTLPAPAGPLIGLIGLVLCLGAVATTALFNQPKWLVPPATRAELGLLDEWRRSRGR